MNRYGGCRNMKNGFVISLIMMTILLLTTISSQNADAFGVAPVLVAVGTIAASTGADVTFTVPVSTMEPDDIILLLAVVRDQDDTVQIDAFGGSFWNEFSNSSWDRGTVSRYFAFWKRATYNDIVIGGGSRVFDKSTATGDTYVMTIVYRGAQIIGDPWTVFATTVDTLDPASCWNPVTVKSWSLIVVALAGEDDNNAAIITSGQGPINYVEHYAESAVGSDGMVTFSEAEKPSTGPRNNPSVDFNVGNPVGWGCIGLALSPESISYITLITLSVEAQGSNCAYGGVRIDSGLDNG